MRQAQKMKARRKLRLLLICVAACLIGSLVVSFLLSAGRRPARSLAGSDTLVRQCGKDSIFIKGFRRTVAEGARTIYDLWASSATLKVRSQQYSLSHVLPATTYFGKGGRDVSLSANEGRYDAGSDDFVLSGDVMAIVGKGLRVRTNQVRFSRKTMTVYSDGEVLAEGEGLVLRGNGLVVDLSAEKATFTAGVALSFAGSPSKLSFLGPAAGRIRAGTSATVRVRANRLTLLIDRRQAEFSGSVMLAVDDNELFAERVLMGWGEKFTQIDWAKAQGIVVAKVGGAVLGCHKAEYSKGEVRLAGEPLIVEGFERLCALRAEDRGGWPGWPRLSSWQKRRAGWMFGDRESFFLLRSAAPYLGCNTLSARLIRLDQRSRKLVAEGDVVLCLGKGWGAVSRDEEESHATQLLCDRLTFDARSNLAVFEGDVLARSEAGTVRAKRLTARLASHKAGKPELETLVFDGSVSCQLWAPASRREEEKANRWDLVRSSARRLVINAGDGTARYEGEVTFRTADMSLAAGTVLAWVGEGGDGLRHVVATGAVVLESGGKIATGGKMVYDRQARTAVLMRHPKLWYGDNVIWGRKIVYNLALSQLEVIGEVRGLFYAQEEDSGPAPETNRPPSNKPKWARRIAGPGKILLWAERLHYDDSLKTAKCTGHVTVRKGDAVFTAETVTLTGDPASGQFDKVEACGAVRIKQADRVGIADRVVYSSKTQQIVLSGNPKVYEFGKAVCTGPRITLLVGQDKQYRVEGQPDQPAKTTLFLPRR